MKALLSKEHLCFRICILLMKSSACHLLQTTPVWTTPFPHNYKKTLEHDPLKTLEREQQHEM